MKDVQRPKFLFNNHVQRAIETVAGMVTANEWLAGQLKRPSFHVVVLGPSIESSWSRGEWDAEWPNYPYQPIRPSVLGELSFGDKSTWTAEYDTIARLKAMQLWQGRNEDGNTDIVPHLMFPGDTRYWGGVRRHGLVVTCSGVEPYFDQMISGMVADTLKATARHMYENHADKVEKKDFLS